MRVGHRRAGRGRSSCGGVEVIGRRGLSSVCWIGGFWDAWGWLAGGSELSVGCLVGGIKSVRVRIDTAQY